MRIKMLSLIIFVLLVLSACGASPETIANVEANPTPSDVPETPTETAPATLEPTVTQEPTDTPTPEPTATATSVPPSPTPEELMTEEMRGAYESYVMGVGGVFEIAEDANGVLTAYASFPEATHWEVNEDGVNKKMETLQPISYFDSEKNVWVAEVFSDGQNLMKMISGDELALYGSDGEVKSDLDIVDVIHDLRDGVFDVVDVGGGIELNGEHTREDVFQILKDQFAAPIDDVNDRVTFYAVKPPPAGRSSSVLIDPEDFVVKTDINASGGLAYVILSPQSQLRNPALKGVMDKYKEDTKRFLYGSASERRAPYYSSVPYSGGVVVTPQRQLVFFFEQKKTGLNSGALWNESQEILPDANVTAAAILQASLRLLHFTGSTRAVPMNWDGNDHPDDPRSFGDSDVTIDNLFTTIDG